MAGSRVRCHVQAAWCTSISPVRTSDRSRDQRGTWLVLRGVMEGFAEISERRLEVLAACPKAQPRLLREHRNRRIHPIVDRESSGENRPWTLLTGLVCCLAYLYAKCKLTSSPSAHRNVGAGERPDSGGEVRGP